MTNLAYTISNKGGKSMSDKRIATITKKRQVTIPKDFFEELNLNPGKIKCYIEDGKIILEPIGSEDFWDFSNIILKELIEEGYEGKQLLEEFKQRKAIVKESMAEMVAEAKNDIKNNKVKDADKVFEEIFSEFD